MNEKDLAKIAKRPACDVLTGAGVRLPKNHTSAIEVAVESAMNEEWWRGYWAGRNTLSVTPAND